MIATVDPRRQDTMDVTYRPLSQMEWAEVADVFNAAYVGYVVPVSMTADELRHRCLAEDVSTRHSVVIDEGGGPIGIALVAVRESRARLAAFGLAASRRGRGLGAAALAHVMAGVPDVARWELEVIERNTPAVRLYEAAGYRVVDRLHGYERPPGADRDTTTLQAIPLAEVAHRMVDHAADDLPWQLDPRTLARLRPPWGGVRDGHGACAVINAEAPDALGLRWFFDRSRERTDDGLARLVRSLATRFAATRPIRMVPLIPSAHDAQMRRLGFVQQVLLQYRMVRIVDAA